MQFPAMQHLLHNYETVNQDGLYNVRVNVLHAPVGITVTYPDHNHHPATIGAQYFYPNEPNGQFPGPVQLKAGDQFCFWTCLTPQVIQNGHSQLINFGVGAQEHGPGLYNEVVQVTLAPAGSQLASPKTAVGIMPPVDTPGRTWQANIGNAANYSPGEHWSISVSHSGNNYAQQVGSVVILANSDGHFYHSWVKGQTDSFILSPADASSGHFYLCVLLQGTHQSDGSLLFQVGDPEKDAKARAVRV